MHEDISGHQYPQPELAESLVNLCQAKYGAEFLDCKAFPHVHPWGYERWYHKCPNPFNTHVKMRLYVRGFYAEDRFYLFFKYDYMLKVQLHIHEARKVVKVQSLSEPLTAECLASLIQLTFKSALEIFVLIIFTPSVYYMKN